MTIATNPLGFECHAYYNTGTFASPTWVEIPIAKDVTLVSEASEADISVRGDGGFAAVRAGLQKIGADFETAYQPAATAFIGLQTAFWSRTQKEFLFLDGTTSTGSGAQGPRVFCEVTKFARKEPLDGGATVDVSVRRTYNSAYTTSWYTQS